MKFKLGQTVKSKYSGEKCKIIEIKFGNSFYLYLVKFQDEEIEYWFYQGELMGLEENYDAGFMFRYPRGT